MNKQQTRPNTMKQRTYYTMRLCPLTDKEKREYRDIILKEREKVRKLEAEYDKALTSNEREKALFAMEHPDRVIEEYATRLRQGYRKEWYPLPERK